MGNRESCPFDFVLTDQGVCRQNCATGYTYTMSPTGFEFCRHNIEPRVRYVPGKGRLGNVAELNEASMNSLVRLRFANAEFENIRLRRELEQQQREVKRSQWAAVGDASAAAGSLAAGATLMNNQRTQFNRSARLVEDTANSLRIRRPPVQPDTEIPKEQRRIQLIVQKNALFIQVVLVLIFASAVAYMIMPMETANYVALAILSVGLIYRIFFVE
jgi:hypothetical protein